MDKGASQPATGRRDDGDRAVELDGSEQLGSRVSDGVQDTIDRNGSAPQCAGEPVAGSPDGLTVGVLSALLVELAVITWRGAGKANRYQPIPGLPVPAEYASAFVVFGALTLVPGRGATPATIFAWGLVVATVLNLFPESGPQVELPGLTFLSPSTDYSTVEPVTVGAT